jgi:hypothetical protein
LPDSKTLAKIDKTVGTDARKAVAMINACVIPMYLGSISDFGANKSDIPNKLGNRLEIKDASGSEVTLGNGSKITPAGDFKRLYDDSNINIFLIDGEVPTTGEASKSLGKKGGYTGGNDDEFGNDGRNEHKEYSPDVLVDVSKSQIKTRMKHNIKTIDPLTHGTISLVLSLEQDGDAGCKQLAGLLKEVMPVSPLAYWYILYAVGLKNDGALARWVANPKKYNKREVLDATFFSAGDGKNGDIDKLKQSKIQDLNRSSITAKIKDIYAQAFDMLEPASQACAVECFGSNDQFCAWWQAMDEFCYLFTPQYVTAYTSGCIVEVTQICHMFHNLVLPGLQSGNYAKAQFLTTEVTENTLAVKERFCTLLSFMVSRGCVSLQGVKDPENVLKIGLGDKPNNIRASSRNHLVIAFWDQLHL